MTTERDMAMKAKVIIAVLAIIVTFSVKAADNNEVYGMAKSLTDCSGGFMAYSEVARVLDRPNAATQLGDTARGWYMAAAWLLFSMGVIPDWKNAIVYTEERAKGENKRWLALIEADAGNDAPRTETLDEIRENLKHCQILADYQEQLITDMRAAFYEKPTR